MRKRIISILSLIVLFGVTFSSCAEHQSGVKENKDDITAEAETAAKQYIDFTNREVDDYVNGLADDYDFNGRTFTWCGNEGQAPVKEEETGDLRNDALYYRQRQIEETFGIDWVNFWPPDLGTGNQGVYDHVMQDVLAGVGAYDLCYGTTIAIAQPLFIQNVVMDLSGFSCLDLTKKWWTPGLMDFYSIGGSIYFLNGAIVTSNYEDTFCIAFNKDIVEEYNIENLYDLVYNNQWTFDKMFEVASVIPTNENGSGTYRFGDPNAIATLYAHGMTLSKYDAEGFPYIELNLPAEMYDLAVKFSAVYGDETICAMSKGDYSGFRASEWCENKYGYDDYNEMFAKGNFLFYFLTTGDAAWLRIYDMAFGILPIPKGDVKQENYISSTGTWGASNVFVPKSAKDTEISDVMLEALASLGYKYIKPAYYDLILKSRATYDHDSKGMIDIIFETKRYDIIDFLATGGNINMDSDFVRIVRGAIDENATSFVSRYKLQALIVNNNIKKIKEMVIKDQNG